MVFHRKMVLAFRYGDDDADDDERRYWWWDWRFWKSFPQQNGFGVQLTETISTAKWFWHSGTVMMTVMMMNNGVDDEIEDSSGDDDERRWWFSLFSRLARFVLFCFVLFGFLWGCRKQLCWDFLMHHNRSRFRIVTRNYGNIFLDFLFLLYSHFNPLINSYFFARILYFQ